MDGQWESVVGIAAVPAALPVLVEHLKRAVAPDDRSVWPLVTDLAAIAWVLGLWAAGLWVVLEHCAEADIAYNLRAMPGIGFYVERAKSVDDGLALHMSVDTGYGPLRD